jgi:hypothetical protein
MRSKIYTNKKGSSIISVLITAAGIAALSLSVQKITEREGKFQKKTENIVQLTSISQIITETLLDKDACLNSIGNRETISNNIAISEIKNRTGSTVFRTGLRYGNNQIKINSIKLVDLAYKSAISSQKLYHANIEVKLEQMNKLKIGLTQTVKKFPISLLLSSTNRLIKCYSTIDSTIDSSINQSCASQNGVWDPNSNKCTLSNIYILKSGDTMTGELKASQLEATSTVNTTKKLCIGTHCRTTFTEQNCQTGEAASQLNASGTITCVKASCSGDSYFRGVKKSGKADCVQFKTKICSADEYVSKIYPDGTKECSALPKSPKTQCTNPNAYLQGINADGTPICAIPCGGEAERTFYEKTKVTSPETCKSQTQTRSCDTTTGRWGAWSPAITYSKTHCNVCKNTTWLPSSSDFCPDKSITQTSNCGATRVVKGTRECIDGGWSSWSRYIKHKEYLGNFCVGGDCGCRETRYKYYYVRYCNNPAPKNGGKDCSGSNLKYSRTGCESCCTN